MMRLSSIASIILLPESFGCTQEAVPPGKIIKTNEMKVISVREVYAAGDITRWALKVRRS